MMTDVYALFLSQDDDQIKIGNPTRLLGIFTTKALAKAARDEIRSRGLYPVGKLEINERILNKEWFNSGFVTEYYEVSDSTEEASPDAES